MELLKLIKTNSNGEKSYYNISAEIDSKNVEITLLIEKGILGQRKSTKVSHIIKKKDIKLSTKKGINSLEKYAIEMGNKLYVKKRKEGYDYFIEDKHNSDNDKKDENNGLSSNITILNNIMSNEDINNSFEETKSNINVNITNNVNNTNNSYNTNNANNLTDINGLEKVNLVDLLHQVIILSPNKMILPTFPVEHKFYEPMLAHPYEKRKRDIIFPCYVQPKLDGVRCIVVDSDLYSRNGNIFPTLSHIKEELSKNTEKLLLDGELYTDDINFEKIVGLVKKGKKTEEEEQRSLALYLNVFDYIEPNLTFDQRLSNLTYFFKKHNFKHIRLVKTEKCLSEKEIYTYLEKYTKEGYEGVMMRNIQGKYTPKVRSANLQKLKKFFDSEFEIVGFSAPESGAEHGCVIWTCKAQNGRTFNVKPLGNLDDRRNQFKHGKDYLGKKLTVKYQEFTNYGAPRFPIGLGIRDYE